MSRTDPDPNYCLQEISESLGRMAVLLDNIRDDLRAAAQETAVNNAVTAPVLSKLPGEPELPSRWARVHAMGQQCFVGEVKPLPRGGVRVTYFDSEIIYPDHMDMEGATKLDRPAMVRTKDIYAIHSIDWLTEQQYVVDVERTQETAHKNVLYLFRKDRWPDGYAPVRRQEYPQCGFKRVSDLKVHGFYQSDYEAQAAAWDDVDGDLGDWEDASNLLDEAEPDPLSEVVQ